MSPEPLTRRAFLTQSSAALATLALPPAALVRRVHRSEPAPGATVPLDQDWLFCRGPLSGEHSGHGPWLPVVLPHCTNADDACDPDHPYFQGQSWYKRRIAIANPYPDGRTVLHFRGAGQTTTVWAGSMLLGKNIGGYNEFVVDLTAASRSTSLLDLMLCCDNTPDAARSPSNISDFCLYGGLYRSVDLVYLPPLALNAIKVVQKTGATGAATLEVAAELYGSHASSSAPPVPVTVEVLNPAGVVVHRSTSRQHPWDGYLVLATIDVHDPARWSPDSPALYQCRVTINEGLLANTAEERFGIRHIAFPEQGLFTLNGKPLFLRGTHRHQDCATGAGAQSDASVRQELGLIKAMGANFIRLAHYQQDRLVLDLCDELGLLVWEEVPWCRAGVGGSEWQANTTTQLRTMILQHFNHPCIAFWGLGNEDDWPGEQPAINQAAIRAYMQSLNDLAHQMDPGRLTSYRRCDFARDIPDVYAPSIWAGWYNGTYVEYAESLTAQRMKQKRLLHIEWGADSLAGRHSEDPYRGLEKVSTHTGTEERSGDFLRTGGALRVSRDGDFSESYACDLFDWYLKTQETLPWLAGSAQWVFKDFASPLRADSPIPRINVKGVVQRDLTPKEAYAVFQSYWSTQPMIHIYGHTWPRRWGSEGEPRLVKVYSNCPQVELFLNGVSQGVRQRDSQNFPAANLRWHVSFKPGQNTLEAVGLHGQSKVKDAIALDYHTQPWSAPAQLRLTSVPSPRAAEGWRKLEVQVLDKGGVLCLDARTMVSFQSTGSLVMLANLGTTNGSRVIEVGNGVAVLHVMPQGTGTVTVSAPGLPETTIILGAFTAARTTRRTHDQKG